MIRDLDRIADSGAAMRFVIGDYGAGKTFFLNLTKIVALEKGLVVLQADAAPDRRIHASGGQAQALYAEMTRNASTRTSPDGGAMASIIERFVTQALSAAESSGKNPTDVIRGKLAHLEELRGGYDFATVVARYWEGYDHSNDNLKTAAIRWMRGEFSTKTDARQALGVRTIVDDTTVYDQLKLLAMFVRGAGYQGLLVSLDEMVHLYKLPSSQARRSNYEQILTILNDVLQGTATNIGFLIGGTPEFLMDTRRGLYSYDALKSRLAENTFAHNGYVDLAGPVIRLPNLAPEDIVVLLTNIRNVMQFSENTVPNEAITAFMAHCATHIGDAYFRTPRNTVTAFVNMLSVLEQNPGADWQSLIAHTEITEDKAQVTDNEANTPEPADTEGEEDELASFKL